MAERSPSRAPASARDRHVGAILRLALPAGLSRFGVLILLMVASARVGQVSVDELAYFGIAVTVQQVLVNVGLGLTAGVPALVAQARGAGDRAGLRRLLWVSLGLAAGFGLASAGFLTLGEQVLLWARQPAAIAAGGGPCLRVLAWGVPGMIMFQTVALVIEALGRPRLPMMVIAVANLVNLALVELLVAGRAGLPARGAVGAATALSITRWGMLVAVVALAVALIGRSPQRAGAPGAPLMSHLGSLLRMGGPIACATLFETGAFTILAVSAGMLGAEALAGFQVIQTVYRIPYIPANALGLAASIQLALAIGRGERGGLARIARTGWGLGLAFLACFGLALFVGAGRVGGLFSADDVFRQTLILPLRMVAVLILFDGSQGLLNATLRGLRDTLVPSLAQLLAFWGVQVPFALWFAFGLGWGLEGLLAGISLGVVSATLLLALRLFRHPQLRADHAAGLAGRLA